MKKEKILIADDDLDLLSVIDWNLNKLGYRTTVAIDGLEATKKIGESRPDLLILDLMMPEVDGLRLCRWIKSNKEGREGWSVTRPAKDLIEAYWFSAPF